MTGAAVKAKQWRQILVAVTDPFAADQPALVKAAAIARRCQATLHVFNAFMLPQLVQDGTYHSSEELLAAAIRERRERLTKVVRRLRAKDAKITVRWDHPPHEAIIRQVLQSRPDLLVADSHRHRRLARLMLANTDWELIRSCPCPLWFVRSKDLPQRPNIVVAVDPSHARAKPARLDDMLLDTARALVEQCGGSIDVLHAHATITNVLLPELLTTLRRSAQPQAESSETAARAVRELCNSHQVAVSRCHVEVGEVSETIETCVKRLAADVLIMGAVSRSRLRAPFIGGTAERVIDHVGCDVLVVKPAGFRTGVSRKFPTLPKRPTARLPRRSVA